MGASDQSGVKVSWIFDDMAHGGTIAAKITDGLDFIIIGQRGNGLAISTSGTPILLSPEAVNVLAIVLEEYLNEGRFF